MRYLIIYFSVLFFITKLVPAFIPNIDLYLMFAYCISNIFWLITKSHSIPIIYLLAPFIPEKNKRKTINGFNHVCVFKIVILSSNNAQIFI